MIRLNSWSVPPSSTSARTSTESIPCSNGYRNSISEIGTPAVVALGEIVALEHPRDRDLRGQAQHVLHVERREPLGVAPDLDALGRHVEDGADLRDVGLGVRVDLLLRELRARRRLPRRVAEHRGEVADDQHGLVSAVLEQAEPAQHDREAEMDVGCGRVDAELHTQRRAALDLRAQLGFGDDVDGVRGQEAQLTVDVHAGDGNKPRSPTSPRRTVSRTWRSDRRRP